MVAALRTAQAQLQAALKDQDQVKVAEANKRIQQLVAILVDLPVGHAVGQTDALSADRGRLSPPDGAAVSGSHNGRWAVPRAQNRLPVHPQVIPRRKGDKLTLIRKLLVRRPGDLAGVAASLRAGLTRTDASTTAPDQH